VFSEDGSRLISTFPVYLFDVDGTLLHSAPDICGAIQTVLAKTNRPDVPEEFLRSYIGKHLIELMSDLFPQSSPAYVEGLLAEYRTTYLSRGHASTELYPGVIETLGQLNGKKSTATTKGTPTTRMVLEKFGLAPFFDHVQGTDGFPAKPSPDVIFAALAGLDAKPEEALFVGDSPADMEAAQRAGVRACAVTYGYGKREELLKWEPEFVIADLRELAPG
jgi:phosphoglycolate phosphatase